MNLGSIVMDEKTGKTEICDIGGDAQVNLARGTVVTHAKAIANEMVEFSGPESFHQDDYSIFYNNVKDKGGEVYRAGYYTTGSMTSIITSDIIYSSNILPTDNWMRADEMK